MPARIKPLALYGTIIHSHTANNVEILENALLCTDANGVIQHLEPNIPSDQINNVLDTLNLDTSILTVLPRHSFLIPGLIDTHNHAPQWPQRGLGRGMQILDWLNEITFKNEAKFADVDYARRVYSQAVRGFLRQGITTASYYGSLHGEATGVLAEICLEMGQRALVGKCNMDRNSPEFYVEKGAAESVAETRRLIGRIRGLDPRGELVRPVVTPRFAISCSRDLLEGLGRLVGEDAHLAVQTHFNEARSEIEATLGLFPEFENEADLYERFGLLGERTILAHCCHMSEYEIVRLRELRCGIAHCPIANTTVGGGFMAAPIRVFLESGIDKIGLGTDSGGGFSISIIDAMRQAFIVSNARECVVSEGRDKSLSIDECFYMATMGGAKVCGLEDTVGNFEVGKEFDACAIGTIDSDGGPLGVITPIEDSDGVRTIFEKFLMAGDDRNIERVWIKGRQVK